MEKIIVSDYDVEAAHNKALLLHLKIITSARELRQLLKTHKSKDGLIEIPAHAFILPNKHLGTLVFPD